MERMENNNFEYLPGEVTIRYCGYGRHQPLAGRTARETMDMKESSE
jgi:hypothetical protein